mgnify:CR=1 FL=1
MEIYLNPKNKTTNISLSDLTYKCYVMLNNIQGSYTEFFESRCMNVPNNSLLKTTSGFWILYQREGNLDKLTEVEVNEEK